MPGEDALMLAEYLADYGYLVVAVGAFIEGETILLLAGYAAQQGALDVRLVLLLGFVGAFAGNVLIIPRNFAISPCRTSFCPNSLEISAARHRIAKCWLVRSMQATE